MLLLSLFIAQVIAPATSHRAAISGRVYAAESGTPIAGAVISFTTRFPVESVDDIVTGTDGRFEAQIPSGVYDIRCSKARFVEPADYKKLTLKPGETRANLDFAMVRSTVVTGRVVDEGGEPLAHAVV